MTPAPALEFSHVGFSDGAAPTLEDVSLRVAAREFWAPIGPDGGGKSTLLTLALGLLAPDSGEIRVFGKPPAEARARVGYVPQFATFPRDFPLAVGQVVLQGRLDGRNWWRPMRKGDSAAVRAAPDRVGVADLVARPIGALSGGPLQRVMIARALVADPALLLLDEPTAHVDTDAETSFFDLPAGVRDGMAIVMVSHDMGLVSRHVDRIACLNRTLVRHGAVPLTEGVPARLYGGAARLVDPQPGGRDDLDA